MKFRSQRNELDAEINLTPLIDVVFLLLIFFMVTTTFSKEAQIKLKLPEATSAEKMNAEDKLVTIQISESGKFAIRGVDDEQPMELINSSQTTLQNALKQAADKITDPIILIRADRLAPHEAVVKVMDAARHQGIYQITFATDSAK